MRYSVVVCIVVAIRFGIQVSLRWISSLIRVRGLEFHFIRILSTHIIVIISRIIATIIVLMIKHVFIIVIFGIAFSY